MNVQTIDTPVQSVPTAYRPDVTTDDAHTWESIEQSLRFKQMRWFLSTLFRGYEPRGFIEFRFIDPEKKRFAVTQWFQLEWLVNPAQRLHHYKALFNSCQRANQDRREIYMGVLPREGQSGKAEGIRRARWWWADLDYKVATESAILDRLETSPLFPNIVTSTGGGLHAYYQLPREYDFATDDSAKFAAALGRFQQLVLPGADKVADIPHVLRVPGFVNWKRGGEVVRVVNVLQSMGGKLDA